MSLEDQMQQEILRLEKDIELLDDEIEKLYLKVVNFMNIRKKKKYNLKILKENFGIINEDDKRILQTDLTRILKESI